MMAKGFCLLLGVALSTGCMHSVASERAFTKEWSSQIEHEREFQSRKARIEGKGRALLGKPGRTQATIDTNSDGKSQLRVGKDNGLSAGMNMNGLEPDVEVKYGLRW